MKKLVFTVTFAVICVTLLAARAAQEGSGSNRGAFLSRAGAIGLVQQPAWLSHKPRRFGEFLVEIRQICCFLAEVVQ
jgi:hypothetical protein